MTAAASGDLIEIDYRITAEDPRTIADAIRVEQTNGNSVFPNGTKDDRKRGLGR